MYLFYGHIGNYHPMSTIDETDRRLLRHYQAEPDLSIAELAAKAGLSQTPCWRRLRRMEAEGIIERRAVLLSSDALGYSVHVIAHIRLKQHDEAMLDSFEEAVRGHPEIVECFVMGGEYDYIVRILASSIEHYERFLKKVLLHLPGVGHVNSSFALKRVKLTTDVPL